MTSLSFSVVVVATCSTIYFVISIFVIFWGIKATAADPSDPTILQHRIALAKGLRFDNSHYEFYCDVCDTFVEASSKHCGACNRCVNQFDHHCKYLNNCVGAKNYKLFFRLIISVFLLVLMHNVTNAFVIYGYLSNDKLIEQQNEKIFRKLIKKPFGIVLWVAIFFNFLALLFLGHLIPFHIYLQKKGLSTFEYIKLQEDR